MTHSMKISDVKEINYNTIFCPGGHLSFWDLATDKDVIQVIKTFYNHPKPIYFKYHARAALVNVKGINRKPLVKGKHRTRGFKHKRIHCEINKVTPFFTRR